MFATNNGSTDMLPLIAIVIFTSISASAVAQPASGERHFELNVLGPDGVPVSGADVQVRSRPSAEVQWVEQGEWVKSTSSRADLRADAEGKLVLRIPAQAARRFEIMIQSDGYGPYWAQWSDSPTGEKLPASFTASLDRGLTISGLIVDENGQPVSGATVHPSVQFKKRPGDNSSLGVGTQITTSNEGRWEYRCVPDSLTDVFVTVTHPEYMPSRHSLPLDGNTVSEPITLQRGLTVMGRVTDPRGNAIEGALVRTKFRNEIRETFTGEDGVYLLGGCEPVSTRIVVSAESMATAMKDLRIAADMPTVDFAMKPGGHVRVRVVDEKGEPIANTRIFFQRWAATRYEYFEFDHVPDLTDANGIWEWKEAPLEPFAADICPPGRMTLLQEQLVARPDEFVFTPPKLLVITGEVVDAETDMPIKQFRVVPGIRSSPTEMNWVHEGRSGAFDATAGKFQLHRDRGYFAHLVRVEAAGYLPAVSRDIKSDEGQTNIRFELKRGKDVAATVLDPQGEPVTGAKVALGVTGGQISIENGTIDDGSTYAPQTLTDRKGQFGFAPQETDYQLIITHAQGYAHIEASAGDELAAIKLTPWARVEGSYWVGGKPAAGIPITADLNGVHSYGRDRASIFTHHDTTSRSDGSFVFPRAIAGRGSIGRRIMMTVSDGAQDITSSESRAVELVAGQTTKVEFGRSGRPVIGKLVPPEGTSPDAIWNFTLLQLVEDLAEPGVPPFPGDVEDDPLAYQLWFQQWVESEAGKAYLQEVKDHKKAVQSRSIFRASVDQDGSFRIDGVPPGDYRLTYAPYRQLPDNAVRGRLTETFSVENVPSAASDTPYDLGLLSLEP